MICASLRCGCSGSLCVSLYFTRGKLYVDLERVFVGGSAQHAVGQWCSVGGMLCDLLWETDGSKRCKLAAVVCSGFPNMINILLRLVCLLKGHIEDISAGVVVERWAPALDLVGCEHAERSSGCTPMILTLSETLTHRMTLLNALRRQYEASNAARLNYLSAAVAMLIRK